MNWFVVFSRVTAFTPVFCGVHAPRSHLYFMESMLLVHTCILWSPCCLFTPVFCGVLAARSHLYFVESLLLVHTCILWSPCCSFTPVFCGVHAAHLNSFLCCVFFALFVFGQQFVPNELLTLPDHLSLPPVYSWIRATRSLVLCVCFLDRCLSLCSFSFGQCVVWSSSIYIF